MKFFFILSTLGFCLSCGIKGPPLPPVDEDVVRKQKAESVTVSSPVGQVISGDATKAVPQKKKSKQ